MNQCDGCRRGLPLKDGFHQGEGWDAIGCTADRYGDSDMSKQEQCGFYCGNMAKTERARVGSLTNLPMCNQCAVVWDTATTAAEAAPDPEVNIVLEALHYLVGTQQPALEAGFVRTKQHRLLRDLEELMYLDGGKKTVDELLTQHPNLHAAVTVLLKSVGTQTLYQWDQIRKKESE